jgi:hypothetical protein
MGRTGGYFFFMKAATRKSDSANGDFTPEQLRAALGNAALEGQRPQKRDLADLRRVVSGQLSGTDYLARIKARYVVSA